MKSKTNLYILRGARVQMLDAETIRLIAIEVAKILKINQRTITKMDMFMEMLEEQGISYDVIDDKEWFKITNAACLNNTILIPETRYTQICKGDKESVFIFFHELGHLLLAHKAMLHHSDVEPTKFEDAEWQADEFSKHILDIMKIHYIPEQLRLPF